MTGTRSTQGRSAAATLVGLLLIPFGVATAGRHASPPPEPPAAPFTCALPVAVHGAVRVTGEVQPAPRLPTGPLDVYLELRDDEQQPVLEVGSGQAIRLLIRVEANGTRQSVDQELWAPTATSARVCVYAGQGAGLDRIASLVVRDAGRRRR